MKLHNRIHAHGPELVFTDPEGMGREQRIITGHGAIQYHEALHDAEAIVHAVTCHDLLVDALKEAKRLLAHVDTPQIDKALADAEGV